MKLTEEQRARAQAALKLALARVSLADMANELSITKSAISQWDICPALRVLSVEKLSGVTRFDLRPDLYPENT